MDEMAKYDVTVTFHVALRPSRHGISVRLCGRLPSDLVNPSGSLTETIIIIIIVIIIIIIIIYYVNRSQGATQISLITVYTSDREK